MRILHVYKDYPPVFGGIEHHLQLLAEGQAARGHQVTVLVTGPGRRTTRAEERGVAVIRAGRLLTVASTPLSLALPWELLGQRPDVTHLQAPYPLGEVAQLLGGRSKITVVSYQSDIVRQRFLGRLYRPLQQQVLARADAVLASSASYVTTSPQLQAVAARCRIVPLGLDVARFAHPDPSQVVALQQRFPGPLLLFVGRLRYYKGLDVLIAAMAQLRARLLVVGRGNREAAWKECAARSPAADRIHFVGDVPDGEMPAYLAAGDVLVLPSTLRSEAFGLVLLEAMAAGTPVVSTDLGTATSTINRHGETGLVVPPGDVAALAQALACLLADPHLRQRLGEQAQARVQREFTHDRMVETVLGIYAELLAARR